MKMITGEYTPDEGVVLHNGKEIHPKSISDSIKEGIAMIHQELAPLPEMNIAQLQAAESQGRDLILIGTDAIPDAPSGSKGWPCSRFRTSGRKHTGKHSSRRSC